MRIRTIKPDLWDDEKFCRLPFGARLLFIGTWNLADDYGILRANPTFIKSKIFAYDESLRVHEVAEWLDELVKTHMLIPIRYNGEDYYKIRTFKDHQVISHPGKRKIPKEAEERLLKEYFSKFPELSSNSPENSSNPPEYSGNPLENSGNIPEDSSNFPENSMNVPETLQNDSIILPERLNKPTKRKQKIVNSWENYGQSCWTWEEIKESMRRSTLIPESLERREKIPRDKIPDLMESFFLRCESAGHDKDRTFRDVVTHFDAWVTKYWKENANKVKITKLKNERTM